MKLFIIIFCLCSSVLFGQMPKAWVRQTDLATGQTQDTFLANASSSYTAPLPIGKSGAVFELYARGTAWDNNIYLLDTKVVGAYSPKATINIVSEDDYARGDTTGSSFVKRTRADRPFNVNIEVQGLVDGSNVLSLQSVYLGVFGKNFDAKTYSSINQPQYLIEEFNLKNGSYNIGPIYHQLTSPAISQGNGEECFTIVRFASYDVPDTIIAQPKIEIWPVASASIDGISSKQVFIDRIPPLVVDLNNLYPDSYTYAQIYKGNQVLGTAGKIIANTELKFGAHYGFDDAENIATNVPQSLTLTINDLSNYASSDDVYTLEIITHTPFFDRAAERLFYVTFEVDRTITTRGRVGTLEISK